eukprot:6320961-Lingulodinium_polyedra.AAC.1
MGLSLSWSGCPHGLQSVGSMEQPGVGRPVKLLRVFVVVSSGGIAALRVVWQRAGVWALGYVSACVHKPASRLVRRRWLGVVE